MDTTLGNPNSHHLGGPLDDMAAAWQRKAGTQVAGALLAILPLAAISAWMYVFRGRAPSLEEMFGGPLIGGGLLILWTLMVHVRVAGDRLANLGVRTNSAAIEVGLGVGLALLFLAMNAGITGVLTPLFPREPPPPGIIALLTGVSRSPLLLLLWLGPVVWIGVAGFEELWRVHLLRRLWCVWPRPVGRWVGIAVAAALFAGVHLYQPPPIMISIFVKSIVSGWVFMRTGRFWALVVGHALYDSVQIALAVIAIRGL